MRVNKINGRFDYVTPVMELIQKEIITLRADGSIRLLKELLPNTDFYIFVPDPEMQCYWWHQIWFPYYGIIAEPCRNCWKTVVAPRTYTELMKLLTIMRDSGFHGKCGIERREYVPRFYGGYFYTNSFDEGKERYRQVRELVDKHISSDVSVILKRGCTEYEKDFGPSDKWEINDVQKEFEVLLRRKYHKIPKDEKTPDGYLEACIYVWTLWAHSIGDWTYLDHNGRVKLFQGPVTYHEE